MFHKVLVATGGSRWSQQAVEYAVDLAKDYALEFMVLSVVTDTPPYFIAEAGVSLEKVLADSERTGRDIIMEATQQASEAGVAYTTELAWGRIAEVICRVASERNCDLIVLGSRGLASFKRFMLGSISNAVAAKAPYPVLIVKEYGS